MSRIRLLATFIIVVLLSIPATTFGQTETDDLVLDEGVTPHPAIDSLYYRFSEAYRTLDASIIAEIYAEQALYLSPDSEIRRGGAAIHESFKASFQRSADREEKRHIAFRIVERGISGPLAYDVGIFSLTRYPKEGESGISRGKFVVVARQQDDGTWRFQVDGYSDIRTD